MSLYSELKGAGIKLDNHFSDLYFECTELSTKILKRHPECRTAQTFISRLDKKRWYEVPFAYVPYWEGKK